MADFKGSSRKGVLHLYVSLSFNFTFGPRKETLSLFNEAGKVEKSFLRGYFEYVSNKNLVLNLFALFGP
jgi:hypothetical protein